MLGRVFFQAAFVLLILPTAAISQDRVYLYGGPDTCEGKFEDEYGLPDMQGWECEDLSINNFSYWHISTFSAEGFTGPPDSNHVLWCGSEDYECEGQPAPGYGNSWNECIDWYGEVPNIGAPTTVRIEYQAYYDLERYVDMFSLYYASTQDFDGFHLVQIWWTYSGGVVNVSETFTVNPANYVGVESNQIQLRLQVLTDSGYSNEDCNYISDGGAVQLDNIFVFLNDSLISETDFEAGDWGGWARAFNPGYGCFAQVWELLDDWDPATDNDTPQLAFLDDGIIVPGTGGSICPQFPYGPDGYVINTDRDPFWYYHNTWSNSVVSPAISTPDSIGSAEHAFVSLDIYEHIATCFWTYFRCRLSTIDIHCAEPKWGNWITVHDWEQGSHAPIYDSKQILLNPFWDNSCDSLRVSLDVRYTFVNCPAGNCGTPAPYIDNVSVYVEEDLSSSPPPPESIRLIGVHPNPFNPTTVISYELPKPEAVSLKLYDLAGRHVRALLDGAVVDAGVHEAAWNGRDESNRPVAAGVYFCRLEAGTYSETKRMALIR